MSEGKKSEERRRKWARYIVELLLLKGLFRIVRERAKICERRRKERCQQILGCEMQVGKEQGDD